MAVILFMMGDRRYVGRLTVMRFHELGREFVHGAHLTGKTADQATKELLERNGIYASLIADRLTRPVARQVIEKIMQDEVIVSSSQTIKLGLAHKII